MRMRPLVWFSALMTCVSVIGAAEEATEATSKPDASILIEAEQLQKKLDDKNLRVLDVRSRGEYAKAHIPGAIRVDVGVWKDLAIADKGLHDVKGWAERVSELGITEDTHVAVYGDSISDTARIWWLLKYVGVNDVSVLDGGWDLWTRRDRPVETGTPHVGPTKFAPEFQIDRLAEIDAVKSSLRSEKVTVIDTRSDNEFAGGRIPGSVHLEWKHLLAADGRFKTPTQLKEIFRQRGILPSETAVCY